MEAAPTIDEIATACGDAFERLISTVAEWFVDDGLQSDEAHAVAALVYSFIEGALVLSKATRSAEPITRLQAALPGLVASLHQ